MAIALRRLRDRVRTLIKENDARRAGLAYNVITVDQVMCEAYVGLSAQLPPPDLYTASAFTISAGTDLFTLPGTVAQWTGNDGQAEYRGDVRIRLRSSGEFLRRRSVQELDSFRNGDQTLKLGIPELFTLWEDKTQGAQGRCYPGAQAAQACDLWATLSADDLRDFVGTGADDLDDVKAQLSREGALALVLTTAADLVEAMDGDALKARKLNPQIALRWRAKAEDLLYTEEGRHWDMDSQGRLQRWVP